MAFVEMLDCRATRCECCGEGGGKSCERCEMVKKGEAWHRCPAVNCPLQEGLHNNCCESCWVSCVLLRAFARFLRGFCVFLRSFSAVQESAKLGIRIPSLCQSWRPTS